MRFEYKPYVDQDRGTIAELLLRSGQIQSDRAERLAAIAANAQLQQGQAHAQAQAMRGQLLGQTIGGIAQAVGSIPGMVQDAKRTQLAEQELGLRTQRAQQEAQVFEQQQDDRAAWDHAQQPAWGDPDPNDGTLGPDDAGPPQMLTPRTPEEVRARMPGHLLPQFDEAVMKNKRSQAELEKIQQEIAKNQAEQLGVGALTVVQSDYDLRVFSETLEALESVRAITPQQRAAQMKRLQGLEGADLKAEIKAIVDPYVAVSQEAQGRLTKAAETKATTARQAAADAETARHNLAMEGRPIEASPGTVIFDPTGRQLASVPPTPTRPVEGMWVTRPGEGVINIQPGQARPGDLPYKAPADPTQAQADAATVRGKTAAVFQRMAELSEKINAGEGLLAKVRGGTAYAAAKANYNDDVAEYEALVNMYTPIMARANGHTGVLTEVDVASTKAGFPRPGDSKTLRDRKIKLMQDLFAAGASPAPGAVPPPQAGPQVGDTRPIPGHPGTEQRFDGRNWVRTK